jgi:hypothetical protein
MTQMSTTPARNTFAAADAQVTEGNSVFHTMIIDFTDDNPSRVATVVIGQHGAQQLLEQLAMQLGYRLVAESTAQQLGAMVRETIATADSRKNTPAAVGSSAVLLNAMTDAMRDMRDELRRADVISG